ncbi:MAG: hypothetical protein U5K76_10870 [Woeseiaceae bacterium]|nr:hypothetical protein [Woeseiaceae bacterium]
MNDARASALQFRYLFVVNGDGLGVIDVTDPARPNGCRTPACRSPMPGEYTSRAPMPMSRPAPTGSVIVDVERPEARLFRRFDAGGRLADSRDVVVASTNASLFAYVADGRNGLQVVQLTSPDSQPNFYGYSPAPVPELIATLPTPSPALALSKGLERDRGVDETGGQVAVVRAPRLAAADAR